MLETEEIDDDYFTPASSTSLANIFGKSHKEDVAENESLKYTPPKPSQTSKPEEQRATQCIYACALLGYEWTSGAYIARGKLGFAILKILKTGLHTVILYDSNKVTLSNMTISTSFEVTVKENVYFSYLDNLKKYWCLYASEEELKKIINLLKSLNAVIIHSSSDDKQPPDMSKADSISCIHENTDFVGKESDTDSSLNKKTKLSILNRMANMGQSVLPPRTMSTEKSSDSSDSNEYKSIRHKPGKVVAKRTRSDKTHEEQSLIESHQVMVHSSKQSTDNVPLFTCVNGQIVPVTNTNLVSSSNSSGVNDINFFISEQRVNNSELRININRMSEKVDQVLGKISKIDNKDNLNASCSFQIDIMQKLLSEYENKIKVYEEFIKANRFDKNVQIAHVLGANIQQQTEEKNYSDKINQLEQACQEKDAKISRMETEYEDLKNKFKEEIDSEKSLNYKLTNDVQKLNQLIANNSEELEKQQLTRNGDENDSGNKIKNLMNATFHAISSSFENEESYTGAMVKNITASVIKRVTIESLNTM